MILKIINMTFSRTTRFITEAMGSVAQTKYAMIVPPACVLENIFSWLAEEGFDMRLWEGSSNNYSVQGQTTTNEKLCLATYVIMIMADTTRCRHPHDEDNKFTSNSTFLRIDLVLLSVTSRTIWIGSTISLQYLDISRNDLEKHLSIGTVRQHLVGNENFGPTETK